MRLREVSAFAALVVLGLGAVEPVAAQGVTGRWTATLDTENGPFPLVFDLRVDDGQVSGSFSNPFISPILIETGSVDGDMLEFELTLETGMRLLYEGVLDGDELTLSTTVLEGAPPGSPAEQTFTAVRQE